MRVSLGVVRLGVVKVFCWWSLAQLCLRAALPSGGAAISLASGNVISRPGRST